MEQLTNNLGGGEPLYRLVENNTKEVLFQSADMEEILEEAERLDKNESTNSKVQTNGTNT
jgi:hypothetical protein